MRSATLIGKVLFDCVAAPFYNSRVFKTIEIASLLDEPNLEKLPGLWLE